MRLRKFVVLFLCFTVVEAVQGQPTSPADFKPGNVASGTLENGMHYYIMHNEEPKDRASFYFAQNVGSILENDTQQGLAHFLEHMAFNGTQNFQEKGMLNYLEKNGLKFGAEINAFTNFDETVYNINQVPATNENLLDSVLLILHDWSGYLSLTDQEIDNERGVVNEEWRSSNTAQYRAYSKVWTEGLLKESQYSQRLPIGMMEVVNNFKYQELRDYYDRWYRPDKQAVIVVGDIDVDQMEQKIKKVFSPIPLKKNLPERGIFEVPINDALIYIKSTDKELGEPTIQFIIKTKTKKPEVKEKIQKDILNSYAGYILNNRFSELVLSPESPALGVSFGIDEFVRPLETMNLNIQPKKDSLLPALAFAVTEFKRFAKYGGTSSEHQRVKAEFKTRLEAAKKNSAKRSNDSYAKEIYAAFFEEIPLSDYLWSLDYKLKVVENITNEQLLQYLASYTTSKGEVVGFIGSDKFSYPDENNVVAALEKVDKKSLAPYVEELSEKQLINEPLTGSKVESVQPIEGIDAKLYTLANGLKLALYPTPFDKEKVFMNAFSMGGESLIDQPLLPNAFIAPYLVSQSGLGDLNKIELQKLLAGTEATLSVYIGDYTEGLSGSSNLNDLEVLLQQVYLNFTAPRFDENAFDILLQNLEKNLVSKHSDVQSIFQDSLELASSNHSPRTIIFDEALINTISLEGARKLFKDRIKNAGDFTFVFVGDFKEEELLALAQKYLGSIPGEPGVEQPANHHMQPKEGITKVQVTEEMQTPQTSIGIYLNGDIAYSKRNSTMIYILGELLEKKYLDRIREEEGGSYGVQVSSNIQQVPEEQFNININFNANPEKTDQLLRIVFDDLKKMSQEIDANEFLEIKNNLKKSIAEKQENNSYWLSNIANNLQNNLPVTTQQSFLAMLEEISMGDIKKIADSINDHPRIVEGVLNPKK